MPLLFKSDTSSTLKPNIKNIKDIDPVLEFLNNYTGEKPLLIIPDLDETLLRLLNMIASSTWKKTYRETLTKTLGLEKATEETNKIYTYARENASVELAEGEKTLQFICKSHACHHVIFVTARPIIPEGTEKQLKACNIPFNVSNKFKQNVSPEEFQSLILAQNGIIYTPDGDKGEAIEKYLQIIGCNVNDFGGILCLDDRLNKAEQVAKAAQRMGMPFFGFRYGRLDEELADAAKLNSAEIIAIGVLQYIAHLEDPSKPFMTDTEARSILGLDKAHTPKARL